MLHMANFFCLRGLGPEYLQGKMGLKLAREGHDELAGPLIRKVLPLLKPPSQESTAEGDEFIAQFYYVLSKFSPEKLSHRRLEENAREAFAAGRYAEAERLFSKAVNAPASSGGRVFIHRDSAASNWFLLGTCRLAIARYPDARKAFQKMIDLGPPDFDMVVMEGSIINVSPHLARMQMLVCFLKEGKPAEGLKFGLKALTGLENHLPGDLTGRANTHYNVACAYALTGKKEKALEHIRKSIKLQESYKSKIAVDPDFKSLLNDTVFQELVK